MLPQDYSSLADTGLFFGGIESQAVDPLDKMGNLKLQPPRSRGRISNNFLEVACQNDAMLDEALSTIAMVDSRMKRSCSNLPVIQLEGWQSSRSNSTSTRSSGGNSTPRKKAPRQRGMWHTSAIKKPHPLVRDGVVSLQRTLGRSRGQISLSD